MILGLIEAGHRAQIPREERLGVQTEAFKEGLEGVGGHRGLQVCFLGPSVTFG
jgi:hypothetical protein